MFFSRLINAHPAINSGELPWSPAHQPRLPISAPGSVPPVYSPPARDSRSADTLTDGGRSFSYKDGFRPRCPRPPLPRTPWILPCQP